MSFKVNDQVQSRGGPSMTVLTVEGDIAKCEWWDQGKRHIGDFPVDVLVTFVPRKPTIFVV